jgi:hypothetical protein
MQKCFELAQRFGELLSIGDYESAQSLLTKETQAVNSPAYLKRNSEGMHRYAPGPITNVQTIEEGFLEDWPDKQSADVACIYVALAGNNFNEAVYLTLAQEDGELRIRDIQWGRP